MNLIDYKKVLDEALTRYGLLTAQRDNIALELARQLEFIRATVNMLSDEERAQFKARMDEAYSSSQLKEASLTESVRLVLQRARGQFLTATQVRDHLVNSGFDFSSYLSNPLASVSTTLRRLKPEEVETTEVRGVAAYKWIGWVRMDEHPHISRPPKPLTYEGMPKEPWKPMKK